LIAWLSEGAGRQAQAPFLFVFFQKTALGMRQAVRKRKGAAPWPWSGAFKRGSTSLQSRHEEPLWHACRSTDPTTQEMRRT